MGHVRQRREILDVTDPFRRISTQTFWDGRTPVVSYGPYSAPVVDVREMTDVVTPNYQKLIAAGHIVSNPCSRRETDHSFSTSSFTDTYYTRYPNGQFNDRFTFENVCYPLQEGVMFGLPVVTTPADSDIAVNAAWNDVRARQAMALVEMAQATMTLQLLGSPLKQARELVKRAKRLDRKQHRAQLSRTAELAKGFGSVGKRVADAANAGTNLWLQWRYGWQQLFFSMQDIMDAAVAQTGKEIRITGRGGSKGHGTGHTVHHHTTNPLWWAGTQPIPFGRADTDVNLDVTFRAGVLASMDLSKADAFGFSSGDIPTAAWELIPFSFVADWFIKVGDWLGAWSPVVNQRVLTTWLTESRNETVLRQMEIFNRHQHAGSGASYVSMDGTASQHFYLSNVKTYTRTVGVNPSALPPLDTDPFRVQLRILDAIALGYQLFGRKHSM